MPNVVITSYSFSSSLDFHIVLRAGAGGEAVAHGTVHVRDGTSNTTMIGESPPQATCADTDGDSIAGITSLQLVGRVPDTGEEVLVAFSAGDNDLDQRGDYTVQVRVGDLTSDVTLAFLPLPAGPPTGGDR